jgi:radical SAM superfamily enzyme
MGLGMNYDDWKLATPEEDDTIKSEDCTYCGDRFYYPEEDGTRNEEGLFFCNENCQESYEIDEEINQNKEG